MRGTVFDYLAYEPTEEEQKFFTTGNKPTSNTDSATATSGNNPSDLDLLNTAITNQNILLLEYFLLPEDKWVMLKSFIKMREINIDEYGKRNELLFNYNNPGEAPWYKRFFKSSGSQLEATEERLEALRDEEEDARLQNNELKVAKEKYNDAISTANTDNKKKKAAADDYERTCKSITEKHHKTLLALDIINKAIAAQHERDKAKNNAKFVGVVAGVMLGGAVGTLIPIPILGTLIGAVVGGACAWFGLHAYIGKGDAKDPVVGEKQVVPTGMDWGAIIGTAIGGALGTLLFPGLGTVAGMAAGASIFGAGGMILGGASAFVIAKNVENKTSKVVTNTAIALGSIIGGVIGGFIGTFLLPVVGTAICAAAGAALGGAICGFVSYAGFKIRDYMKSRKTSEPAPADQHTSLLDSANSPQLTSRPPVSNPSDLPVKMAVSGAVAGASNGAAMGAAVGAILGTFIFPVIGTAVGAAFGALIGATAGAAIGGRIGYTSASSEEKNQKKSTGSVVTGIIGGGKIGTYIGAFLGASVGLIFGGPLGAIAGGIIGAGIGSAISAGVMYFARKVRSRHAAPVVEKNDEAIISKSALEHTSTSSIPTDNPSESVAPISQTQTLICIKTVNKDDKQKQAASVRALIGEGFFFSGHPMVTNLHHTEEDSDGQAGSKKMSSTEIHGRFGR